MKLVATAILFFICLLIAACGYEKSTKNDKMMDTSKTKELTSGVQKLYIKDPSRYTAAFLTDLRARNYPDSIKLVDDYIVAGSDTIHFPNDLKIGKEYLFVANFKELQYKLIVQRINETAINFDLQLYQRDSLIVRKKGVAELNAMFFLGTEVPEDDVTGEGYGASEYTQKVESYIFQVDIGIGLDDSNRLRASVKQMSDDKLKSLSLGGNITFRSVTK